MFPRPYKRQRSDYTTQESQSTIGSPRGQKRARVSEQSSQLIRMPATGYNSTYGYGSSSQYGGARQRKPFRRTKISPKFSQAVKKIIYRTSEAKEVNSFATEQSLNNGANPIYFDFPNPDVSARNNGRDGNKIHLESISGTLVFHNNGTGANQDMYVRMIVMEIKSGIWENNSEITANLWQPSQGGFQDVTAFLDVRDLTARPNTETYRVLKDELILCTIGAGATAPTWAGNGMRKFYCKLNKNLIYKDADTESPSNVRYAVMLLARDAENDGAVTTVEASGNLQMKYRDV